MVRLIASDLDGTLLQNGQYDVSDKAIDLIKKLRDYDVLFAPASGRQLSSLKKLFAKVADDLIYICLIVPDNIHLHKNKLILQQIKMKSTTLL